MPAGDIAILKSVAARFDAGLLGRGRKLVSSIDRRELLTRLRQIQAARTGRRIAILGGVIVIAVVALIVSLHGRATELSASSANATTSHPMVTRFSPKISRTAPPAAVAAAAAVRSRNLPSDFTILLKRAVFARGGVPMAVRSSAASSSAGASAAAPANTLALKGIFQEDSRYCAFVQDVTNQKMIEVHVGQSVGRGKIVDMTLFDLGYAIDGRLMRIEVGSWLDGANAGAMVPSTASADTPKPPHRKRLRPPE